MVTDKIYLTANFICVTEIIYFVVWEDTDLFNSEYFV